MRILGFFRRSRPGDPLRNVATTEKLNRICNILEDIQGQGCHIEKPTNADGYGWRIVVDGHTSDLDPAEPTEPGDESGKDIWAQVHDVIDGGGGGGSTDNPLVLASTGTTANSDTWSRTSGRPVQFVPYRVAYDSTAHILYQFVRVATYSTAGSLASVSAETRSPVFEAEEETLT